MEQDHHPVAVIRTPLAKGRLLSESIALAEVRGTTAVPDQGFMRCNPRFSAVIEAEQD